MLSPFNQISGDRPDIEKATGLRIRSPRAEIHDRALRQLDADGRAHSDKKVFVTSYTLKEIAGSNRIPLRHAGTENEAFFNQILSQTDLPRLYPALVLVPEKPITNVETWPTSREVSDLLEAHKLRSSKGLRRVEVIAGYQVWLPHHLAIFMEDAQEYPQSDEWPDSIYRHYLGKSKSEKLRVGIVGRHGKKKFGGVEDFIDLLRSAYKDLGFETMVFERTSSSGTPDELRRWIFANDIEILHTFSGMGVFTLEAVEGLSTRVIYGVHFWREVLGKNDGLYFDKNEKPVANDVFYSLLRGFDMVYANSPYSSRVIEATYGVRLPILPTAVRKPDDALVAGEERGSSKKVAKSILIPNLNKSGQFALQIASLMPDYSFTLLDSQPGEIPSKLPENAILRPKVENFSTFVLEFDAVLLPFFKTPETYSRVAAESLLAGVPTLCADFGNLRNMTHQELVLPADPHAWAKVLRRVCEDSLFRRDVSNHIAQSSTDIHGELELKERLGQILAKLDRPRALVGVGSGLGNMLHTTPAIRSLGKRYGLDVTVNADHPGSLFLLQNVEHTRYVFTKGVEEFMSDYDEVVVSHSWGKAEIRGTHQALKTRSKFFFRPSNGVHESIFNWQSISWCFTHSSDEDFDPAYFVGEKKRTPVGLDNNYKPIVGLHAGSKDGHWATKRWTGYENLVSLLEPEFEFRSFGLESEKVQNTKDMTGGSLEEMCDSVAACDYFIGNDSGVTHLAYAMGIPTVFVFGPTAIPSRGPSPYFGTSRTVTPRTDCYPCEIKRPEIFLSGDCKCIIQVNEAEVVRALREMGANEH